MSAPSGLRATPQPPGPPPALAAVLAAAGPRLPELLERVEGRLAELAEGHGRTLADHAGATIAAGGKRLRPILVLLAAGADLHGGDGPVRAGVAVELVHSATLVHDDVLDAASLRRGRPTVVALAGRGMATATGDLLFSRAFHELARNGRPDEIRTLAAASRALAEGELLQRADAWEGGLTVERYLRRCELKTGRLFAAACQLGALEGRGGSAVDGQALGEFGSRIGVAFQVLDDVLDVAPAALTGKHRGADLLDGTVTLPLILARRADPGLARLDLRGIDTQERAEAVCDAIADTDALSLARAHALEEVVRAKAALPSLEPQRRRALELVADGTVARAT